MSKILFLEWQSLGNVYINNAFKKCGFQVEIFPFEREEEDTRKSEKLAGKLVEKLTGETFEFVFSFNYFPIVAIACKACGVKYVSWTYDSPFIQLFSQTIVYDTNYIFVFDKAVCCELREKGAETVYYLPMAADVLFYDQMIPNAERKEKYKTDVTFIGSMYREKKHNLFRHLENLDDYTKGYLDALMQAQKNIYGYNFLEQALTSDIMENVKKVCPIGEQGDGFETASWTFANYFLARKITATERLDIFKILQERYKVQLFTYETTPDLPLIENMGKVDYYNEAPYIFKCGKIHLNISLRSILTGIPLRAFDIMGCGGFLLTNYQEDFLEFFVPDQDYVYYENYEDLVKKIDYYLEHDEKRMQIAENAYHKVKEKHTYEHRVEEILRIIGI